ncbi:hypothetical protein Q4567_01435 [Aliiglaciecola sp. 2_MG-2023]|uniref:hypothetical protein n=1 Tax=unclassified Aliiglaciecola TaxID=2593648 RepID=UPI0026E2867B|nr:MULTISPECIES: hypothetical protein [unclassified Aliiglaciecola]MDO6709374.1 hypothetical protein [Aliiglaciecola sp. 2_MG-2023]MDO6750522.1 hypothetical protein [Aliiglaciecola sp. 1_MG-2023]
MVSFIEQIKGIIQELSSLKVKTIFTIATTSKEEEKPYITPLRLNRDFAVAGCVIFDQSCLLQIIKIIDGEVDIVLVDTEKKIPLSIHTEQITDSNSIYANRLTVGAIETGNLSKICFQQIKKSQTFEFKPNDLTVNSAWSFLSQRLGVLSGKRIALLGAGNIGSKLALKLVECGAEVHTYRQQAHVGYQIASGLNLIKHENTLSNITFHNNLLSTTFNADVVIGCSNGIPIISEDVVQTIKKNALIVDLGKNNITHTAIQFALLNKLELYRVDVTAALEGFIYEMLKMDEILSSAYGRKELAYCTLVSGGYFGSHGDIIVDNISKPSIIFGIANGNGSVKKELSTEDSRHLEKLKSELG